MDYIFFTGGVTVGKIVMEKAQKFNSSHIGIGWKKPLYSRRKCKFKIIAKRIVFGKYLNSGQTCVAPDYLLIQENIKDEFEKYLKEYITLFYTNEPLKNEDYTKIVNERHFNRLVNLIKGKNNLWR